MAAPLISPQSSQLVAYGLLFGGSAIVGKLVIDALLDDVNTARDRRNFIGPIREAPRAMKSPSPTFGDAVRIIAMGVSVYSMIADLPTLIAEWGKVQATVTKLTQ